MADNFNEILIQGRVASGTDVTGLVFGAINTLHVSEDGGVQQLPNKRVFLYVCKRLRREGFVCW